MYQSTRHWYKTTLWSYAFAITRPAEARQSFKRMLRSVRYAPMCINIALSVLMFGYQQSRTVAPDGTNTGILWYQTASTDEAFVLWYQTRRVFLLRAQHRSGTKRRDKRRDPVPRGG
eukprot:3362522-Rhodomonas_salina.1